MTAIDRTMYRRMKRSYAPKELIEAYTPYDHAALEELINQRYRNASL